MLKTKFNSYYEEIKDTYNTILDRLKKNEKFQFKIPKIQIGLDIGTDSIKFAEIKIKGQSRDLLSYRIVPIAHLKGKPLDEKSNEISEILNSLLKSKNEVPIYTAVSGSDVIIKNFNIAQLSGSKLKNAVFWASKKYVPFPLEEAYFDYSIIGDIEEKEIKKKEVMVVAAAKQLIHGMLELFKKSRVKMSGITATPFALWNFLKVTETKHASIALIDIGAENTTIAIFQDNALKFAREIVTSGNSITDSIASQTSLSFEEAEKLKIENGLSKNGASKEFGKAIMMVVERLINEIQRSLSFYRDKHPEFNLEKIYLTGGTARLKGLSQFMEHRLNTDIEVINSFEKLGIIPPSKESDEFDKQAPVFTKAVSLALKTNEGIDLLPPEARQQRLLSRLIPFFRISVVFIILFCLILSIDIFARVKVKTKSLNLWKSNMKMLNHMVVNPGQIQMSSESYRIMQETLDTLEKEEIIDLFILKEVTNIIPESIVLENLSIKVPEKSEKQKSSTNNRQFEIKGIVYGKEVNLEVELLEFLVTLDISPFLKNPVLLEKERDILARRDILRFAIHCDFEL